MWPLKTKKQKDQERYDEGFQYAAVHLLKGKAVSILEANIECARHFDDYDHFEYGMDDVVSSFKRILKENK